MSEMLLTKNEKEREDTWVHVSQRSSLNLPDSNVVRVTNTETVDAEGGTRFSQTKALGVVQISLKANVPSWIVDNNNTQ